MNPRLLLVLTLLCSAFAASAQLKSPKEFLGYEIGERFTPHHKVVAYFEHVAANSDMIELKSYGTTYELRPLIAAFVSTAQNIQQLETIRTDNLKRTGMMEGSPSTRIPLVWMSYNAHGNEAVGSETAMKTLYELVDPAQPKSKAWLANTVVIIDPCLNPDGQSRYVNWFHQRSNKRMQPDPQSAEHYEPWPGGRPNHYLYDLNRDWAWQVQKESQERIAFYNQWMPQVHVDFHEQGINSPYFFAPAAEPIHHFVTPFQREFMDVIGRNNAKYFDQNAWLYFTREQFDLFYPSYGDSWPMFNGAIGMTYEQAGHGRAGLSILTALGDTLTLTERVLHHHTAGLASIETSSVHADRLMDEFTKYFKNSQENPAGKYKSYVIKGDTHPERLAELKLLLDKNGIRYSKGKNRSGLSGYDYQSGKTASFQLTDKDLIVSAYQPKSMLAQTLFEPQPTLSDSLTYDISSWALPYAYGLQAYALETRLEGDAYQAPAFVPNTPQTQALAYIAPWHAKVHGQFLSALLKQGYRVRYAERTFTIGKQTFQPGSLIISRSGNERKAQFHQEITQLANQFQITLNAVTTGYVDTGKDFGSDGVKVIVTPKIALVGGSGSSSLNVGEVWHYLEEELDYPFTMLEHQQLGSVDLSPYNVLILPSGNYRNLNESAIQKLTAWVASGGKLILIESAISSFIGKPGFSINTFATDEERKAIEKINNQDAEKEILSPYQDRERSRVSRSVAGAIYEVRMDATYPLGYGTQGKYYTLKNSGSRYGYLSNGINAGVITHNEAHRSGFIGYRVRNQIPKSLVFGAEHRGGGAIVYLADNPLFRGFWENGKLIFNNALFMVGQ
jgi:hypothetical protein